MFFNNCGMKKPTDATSAAKQSEANQTGNTADAVIASDANQTSSTADADMHSTQTTADIPKSPDHTESGEAQPPQHEQTNDELAAADPCHHMPPNEPVGVEQCNDKQTDARPTPPSPVDPDHQNQADDGYKATLVKPSQDMLQDNMDDSGENDNVRDLGENATLVDDSGEHATSEKLESETTDHVMAQPQPEDYINKSHGRLPKHFSAEAPSSCVKTQAASCQRERMQKVENLMNWPSELLRTMFAKQNACDIDYTYQEFLEHLHGSADGIRMSTAFSGVDTPATALELLSLALSNERGLPLQDRARIKNVFGVEWFSKSQAELQRHPCGPEHLFDDMNRFWTETMQHKIDAIMSQGQFVDVMKRLISTTDIKTLVRPDAYCLKCDTVCKAP